MKTIGFHASSAGIRYVVLNGTATSAGVVQHAIRPLKLQDDRVAFLKQADSVFNDILLQYKPEAVGYILSMDSKTKAQIAANVLPMAALVLKADSHGIQVSEFIAPNFSKSFFKSRGIVLTDKYKACDAAFGVHPPNWTNSERLAALAGWGAM